MSKMSQNQTPPGNSGATKSVVVVGDVTMDWNIGRLPTAQVTDYSWNTQDLVRANLQRGGAILLGELIEAVSKSLESPKSPTPLFAVDTPAVPDVGVEISPYDEKYHHSYANWALYKYEEDSSSIYQNVFAWRVKNFVGLNKTKTSKQEPIWKAATDKIGEADIVVLDDAALGFRYKDDKYYEDIFKSLSLKPEAWIVLKMGRPVAESAPTDPGELKKKQEKGEPIARLWDYLVREKLTERLIAVVTAKDLRLSEARISKGLSWERTAQDLFRVLTENRHLNKLSRCAHVVVSFETTGVFLLTHQERREDGIEAPLATLFFDPETIEDMWDEKYDGGIIGYTSCLVASIVYQLGINGAKPQMAEGIKSGLAAMRKLLKEGYGKRHKDEEVELKLNTPLIADVITRRAYEKNPFVLDLLEAFKKELNQPALTAETLLTLLQGADKTKQLLQYAQISKSREDFQKQYEFAEACVKALSPCAQHAAQAGGAHAGEKFWTILDDICSRSDSKVNLEGLAKAVVTSGIKEALKNIPQGKFDKLVTVDRREIESYRSIATLIREYKGQEHQERPLSIAVFGPPGAGKSFGISAVAKTVMPEQGKKLTFNLSQFSDPRELWGALHQVRDEALAGNVPLVFWDEFDTSLGDKELGWLRYFLAPMQDGKFQAGEITHPIGRAIFIFAGGTCESMEKFNRSRSAIDEEKKKFEGVKGPDFVSRLKGYIDILGPNPKHPDDDPDFIIRRAILLRSQLEQNAPQLFELPASKGELSIDSGVMTALLQVPVYKHGARSMESIINMSQLAGKSSFERSSLPSEEQLNLHVDGREFYSLTEDSL
jgi:hypothetical protein